MEFKMFKPHTTSDKRRAPFFTSGCFKRTSSAVIVPLKLPVVNLSRVLGLSPTIKFRPDELFQVDISLCNFMNYLACLLMN